jgi:hypothetical protein
LRSIRWFSFRQDTVTGIHESVQFWTPIISDAVFTIPPGKPSTRRIAQGGIRGISAHQMLAEQWGRTRKYSGAECRGRNQDFTTTVAVSFRSMDKQKAQREHRYFRVVVIYSDGETSANKVFQGQE